MNYEKLGFGEALNSLGKYGSVGHSDCHNYGSVNGCDSGCPQLNRGKCPNPSDVIFGEYKGAPTIDDIDEYERLIELYKDDLFDPAIVIGDAIESLKNIPDKSIDFILADHPYGTTKNIWDKILNLELLWPEYWRILKPNGCIALFAQQPYNIILGASQLKYLRYEWIWEKSQPTGHLNANDMPMKAHENILIFYKQLPTYNPQKTSGHTRKVSLAHHKSKCKQSTNYNHHAAASYDSTDRFPRSVLKYKSDKQKSKLHPNQKPEALCEYFIKTYTDEGQVVLDNTAGSGTTGVAAMKCKRRSILIDNDPNMLSVIENRIKNIPR